MDRLKQRGYNVKNSPQGMLGERRGGQQRRTPTKSSGGRRHEVGHDAPELICDCDIIPFPHFTSQCTQLRERESRDAIAHTPAASETPEL